MIIVDVITEFNIQVVRQLSPTIPHVATPSIPRGLGSGVVVVHSGVLVLYNSAGGGHDSGSPHCCNPMLTVYAPGQVAANSGLAV